ncbi:Nramp family divalent metal transporter [Streptomyces cavernicola]|uniref:Nramp family divalent metal transporter n=1 Tax=Streptomyces cavernicola TaxID=3043613 RepID=A0ABT6S5R2_9ACTN|nr:Nramp family divalent metal transporter [Streptomyces sp. B-S-A6]MDI3403408.1 Nramp family divalent metal transporter [Streptomyces sp. B-S-A6]
MADGTMTVDQEKDPYVLDPAMVKEPPKGWRGGLRFLGPGMITSAAVVGSGELLTATTLGAEVGFMLFWLVFVSTFVKVWVQVELARWSISTGKAAITGYNQVPPKIAGRGWMAWLVLLMFLQFLIGQAGVIGAGALAFSTLLPIGGDPFSTTSIAVWVLILVVIAIAIHVVNRYKLVESISTVLVVLVTAFAVVMVFLVQFTEFQWSVADVSDGLRFQVSAGSMGVALSMFGMTGVGAGEITAYTYWCVEKGYAAWAGPNDGSEAWVRRARGWIRVMKLDAWVAWVVYTVSTAALYMLGAAVLHPQPELRPEGPEVMGVISSIFTSTVGQWGGTVFLVGAGVALFKTIIANVPSLGRQVGNTLAVFGAFDWTDMRRRDRWMRVIMVVLPITWGLLAVAVQAPLTLVVIAGILNSLFLMGVAVATLHLSRTETDPRVKDGKPFTVLLVISAVAIFAVGFIGLTDI